MASMYFESGSMSVSEMWKLAVYRPLGEMKLVWVEYDASLFHTNEEVGSPASVFFQVGVVMDCAVNTVLLSLER